MFLQHFKYAQYKDVVTDCLMFVDSSAIQTLSNTCN